MFISMTRMVFIFGFAKNIENQKTLGHFEKIYELTIIITVQIIILTVLCFEWSYWGEAEVSGRIGRGFAPFLTKQNTTIFFKMT